MDKKFINFDTNYINKILDNELEANKYSDFCRDCSTKN